MAGFESWTFWMPSMCSTTDPEREKHQSTAWAIITRGSLLLMDRMCFCRLWAVRRNWQGVFSLASTLLLADSVASTGICLGFQETEQKVASALLCPNLEAIVCCFMFSSYWAVDIQVWTCLDMTHVLPQLPPPPPQSFSGSPWLIEQKSANSFSLKYCPNELCNLLKGSRLNKSFDKYLLIFNKFPLPLPTKTGVEKRPECIAGLTFKLPCFL